MLKRSTWSAACTAGILMILAVARAADPIGSTPPAPIAPQGPALEIQKTREYVGHKKCRMCHTAQHESWLQSPKAHSWEALLPGVRLAAKHRASLDGNKDYTTDQRCLKCHSVGFGEPGGYAIPNVHDDVAKRHAKARQGAGCESCHGPGSEFVEIMGDVLRNKRGYDPQELLAAGRRPVTRDTCRKCHNGEAVCMANASGDSWLKVDITQRHGFHEEFPLKYRQQHRSQDGTVLDDRRRQTTDTEERKE